MHANMHCTDSSQVGGAGVVVGLGHILGHMTKCTYMQDICTIVHVCTIVHMFAHVLCKTGLVIMPKTLVLTATYTCGEGEWMVEL